MSILQIRAEPLKNDGATVIQLVVRAFCTVNSAPLALTLNSLFKCSSEMPPREQTRRRHVGETISIRHFTSATGS
jgi:hypothetical protein